MSWRLQRTFLTLAMGLLAAHITWAAEPNAGERPGSDDGAEGEDAGMVRIGSFAIDRFEYPNRLGARPRVNVSWDQARELCGARGKRLCTESEWQLAAGGPANLRYGYGPNFENGRCNTPTLSDGVWERSGGTAPSGAFGRCCSEVGVYDMVGNVWEWTADPAAASQDWRVVRGGSWFSNANLARADGRYSRFLTPDYRLDLIGFRCCGDPAQGAAD
jgi:eukaryotic-like serine/threonine-protein kinase